MQRFEDVCNSTNQGSKFYYTSSMVTMDEELLGSELGWRVVYWITQKAIDHWDALMDLLVKEDYEIHKRNPQSQVVLP